jgi:hypothetical protein
MFLTKIRLALIVKLGCLLILSPSKCRCSHRSDSKFESSTFRRPNMPFSLNLRPFPQPHSEQISFINAPIECEETSQTASFGTHTLDKRRCSKQMNMTSGPGRNKQSRQTHLAIHCATAFNQSKVMARLTRSCHLPSKRISPFGVSLPPLRPAPSLPARQWTATRRRALLLRRIRQLATETSPRGTSRRTHRAGNPVRRSLFRIY